MTCNCTIRFNVDDDDELYTVSEQIHHVEVTCSECNELVDHALFTLYLDVDNNPKVNVICDDCLSVRNHLFCDFPLGNLWDEFYTSICEASEECEQFLISEDCLLALTPKARAVVCEAINEHWEEMDNNCVGGE